MVVKTVNDYLLVAVPSRMILDNDCTRGESKTSGVNMTCWFASARGTRQFEYSLDVPG